jgi:hypothetical protein
MDKGVEVTMRRFLRHFKDVIITFLLILDFVYFGLIAMSEMTHKTTGLDRQISQSKWEMKNGTK